MTSMNRSRTLATLFAVYLCALLIIGLWPLNFCEQNHAIVDHRDGLILSPPSTAYSPEAPKKLLSLKNFTIFIHVSSDFFPSKGFGSILSYGLDYERMNFLVGQWRSGIELRLSADHRGRAISFGEQDVFTTGNPTWFAMSYDGAVMVLYQDGKKIAARRTGPLTFNRWNSSYPLVVGSDAWGRSSWKGSIRTIAIFNRALQEQEILALSGKPGDLAPLICYAYADMDGPSIKDSGTPPPAELFVPHLFVPYQRDFLELPGTRHIKFTGRLMDIIINVAGFVPLGLILSLYYSQGNGSFIRPLIMALIVGASTSLIIESSQAFLASRSSSMLDLVNNMIGSSLGVFFHHLRMVPISQQRT
jgi:VanZ family protein